MDCRKRNFPVGKSKYSVKITSGQDAIYIGNDDNHFTILKDTDGFHHTVNQAGEGQQAATTIDDLITLCSQDCTPEMMKALTWMRDRCTTS